MAKSSVYKLFGTEKALEKTGIWINYGDVKFLVARAGGSNIAYAESLKARIRPVRHQLERDLLSVEDDLRINAEVYADSIIKDVQVRTSEDGAAEEVWEHGIPSEDGKVLPYSKAALIELLTGLPDMFRDIQQCSRDSARYLKEHEEADEKN